MLLTDNNQIKPAAQLNIPRCFHAAATCADLVYVFGGRDKASLKSDFTCVAEVEQYNWHADKWTILDTRLSVPRFELATACVKGNIYLIGGSTNATRHVNTFNQFNIQTNVEVPYSFLPSDNFAIATGTFNIFKMHKSLQQLNPANILNPVCSQATGVSESTLLVMSSLLYFET